jgi:hypothetical protein
MRTGFPFRFAQRRVGAALLACACVFGTSAAAAAEVKPHPVQDPHYGDGLFQFYQERYFSSITGLMVSQHFERVPKHADEAELLRGGMLLSYGLHREAGEIFTALIDKSESPGVRDRAWYYVAKIRYQRGYALEAEAALARIGKKLPKELDDDRLLLQAQLLMARGDHADAADVLGTLAPGGSAALYARYNLGVALVRSGKEKEGRALLDALGQAPLPAAETNLPVEEFAGLRDKANLALGYAALQDDKPEDARAFLERVRLEGLQSNKALLGFGWAADALKDPKLALVPWTELAGRDSSDEAVLEARIAVPYAYASLRAYGQALDRYNDAITAFERERTDLDESIAAIRAGRLLEALLAGQGDSGMGWFGALDRLPDLPDPRHAARLAPVLATHEFQEGFKNYRDLQFLADNLKDWADKLGVFDDMLTNRRQAYAERLPKILAQADTASLGALQQRRDALAAELVTAEESADATAFADDRQREQGTRLARVQASLQQAGSDSSLDEARERARRIAGALDWQLSQEFPGRLWNAKKALAGTTEALAEARRHEAALAQAQRDEPAPSGVDSAGDGAAKRTAARPAATRHYPAAAPQGAAGRVQHPGPFRRRPALRPREPQQQQCRPCDAEALSSHTSRSAWPWQRCWLVVPDRARTRSTRRRR